MKKMSVIPLGLVLLLVFGFGGIAFAGGGWEDPTCPGPGEYPEPDSGKFLHGDFSVSRETPDLILDIHNYRIQFSLKRKETTHLYSFSLAVDDGNLCGWNNETLLDNPNLEAQPCTLGVAGDFDLEGIPVIHGIDIINQDKCDTDYEMISGRIRIRVVPVVPVE